MGSGLALKALRYVPCILGFLCASTFFVLSANASTASLRNGCNNTEGSTFCIVDVSLFIHEYLRPRPIQAQKRDLRLFCC